MVTEISDAATAVEEVAVGASVTAAEAASQPVGTARKQVKGLERKGASTSRRLERRLSAWIPNRLTLFGVEVDRKLPEKMAIKGLRMVRIQARRTDVVGDVAKQTLRIFNGSFKTIARAASRLEEASTLAGSRETVERKPTRRRRPARHRAV